MGMDHPDQSMASTSTVEEIRCHQLQAARSGEGTMMITGSIIRNDPSASKSLNHRPIITRTRAPEDEAAHHHLPAPRGERAGQVPRFHDAGCTRSLSRVLAIS